MTAPTWTVDEVNGMTTLLRDDEPVAYLDGGTLRVSPMFDSHVFDLLIRVHAPDEATIERLAEAVHAAHHHHGLSDMPTDSDRDDVRAVLAALAAAPGPTDDEAVSPDA